MITHQWIKGDREGVDFSHTPVIELANGRITVLVHPESGRVVQVFSAAGTAHLVCIPAQLGKSFRAFGVGEIRYSCDMRGWGYEDRWYPLDLAVTGWTHTIEEGNGKISVHMVSHPEADTWDEVTSIPARTVTIEEGSDTVTIETSWENTTSSGINNFYSVYIGATPGLKFSSDGWVGQHHREHLLAETDRGKVRQYSYWDLAAGGHSLHSGRFLTYDSVEQEGLLIESDCDDVEGLARPGGSWPVFGLTFHACRYLKPWSTKRMTLKLTPVQGALKSLGGVFAGFRPTPYPAEAKRRAAALGSEVKTARAAGKIDDEEAAIIEGQLHRLKWWKATGDKHGYDRCAEVLSDAERMWEAVRDGAKSVSRLQGEKPLDLRRQQLAESNAMPTVAEVKELLNWFDTTEPMRVGAQPWQFKEMAILITEKGDLLDRPDLMRKAYRCYRDSNLVLLERYGATTVTTVHAVYVGDWFEGCYEKLVRRGLLSWPQRVQAWAAYLDTVDWMEECGGGALKTNWGWCERGLISKACRRLPFHPKAGLWRKLTQELIDVNMQGQCDEDGAPAEPISYIGNATYKAVMLDLEMKRQPLDKPIPVDYADGRLYLSFEFFYRAAGPDGRIMSIGDNSGAHAAEQLSSGARLFGQGQWAAAARGWGWTPPDEPPTLPWPDEKPEIQGNDLLKHAGFAQFRNGRTQLCFWYGHMTSHGQNDHLTFDFWAEGQPLSYDPGGGEKGYTSHSYVYWTSQTRAHNSVTLNDESYTARDRPSLVTWEDGGAGDVVFAASGSAYSAIGSLTMLERRVTQQDLRFTFTDRFSGDIPAWAEEMIWRFNSAVEPQLVDGAAVIQCEFAEVRIHCADPMARIEIMDCSEYAGSREPQPWQVRVIKHISQQADLITIVDVIPRS